MKTQLFNILFLGLSMFFLSKTLQAQSTYLVNSTLDTPDAAIGDGVCNDGNGNCTLRAAIQEANAGAGHDIINFNIMGGGLRTIFPTTQLPTLTDNAGVTIDGTSQPGSSLGMNPPATANINIEIKGALAITPPPVHGLWVLSDSNILRGLIINEFSGDGIRIEGTVDSTDDNLVEGCFIGVDKIGQLDLGNATASSTSQWWAGISIIVPPCDTMPVFTKNNTIRHCLISGNGAVPASLNRGEGVSITNCPPGDNGFNRVEYNYIGTNVFGNQPIGNDSDGVTIAEAAHDNVIDHNVISANGFSGVGINGLSNPVRLTTNNTVSNNIIGLDANATGALPNGFQGVSIGMYGPNTWGYAPNNSVIGNTISQNTGNGVLVAEFMPPGTDCDGNLISQNSIFANGQLGIDLVSKRNTTGQVTLNDPAPDLDSGPNQECNFPVITSASIDGYVTQATISGTVDFPNPSQGTVEVFLAASDPSGYGEGMTYLGSTTPDAMGNWTLVANYSVTTNDILTATSTDGSNNTSEFSGNFTNILSGIFDSPEPVEFILYPNPAQHFVIVRLENENTQPVQIELFHTTGQQISNVRIKKASPTELKIDLGNLATGIYWVKVVQGDRQHTQKISVMK